MSVIILSIVSSSLLRNFGRKYEKTNVKRYPCQNVMVRTPKNTETTEFQMYLVTYPVITKSIANSIIPNNAFSVLLIYSTSTFFQFIKQPKMPRSAQTVVFIPLFTTATILMKSNCNAIIFFV